VGGTGLTEDELFEVFGLAPPARTATARTTPDTQRPAPNQRQRTGAWTQTDLQALSPANFEELTVKLYKAMRFSAQRTRQSRDEGVDVIAIRDLDLGRDKLAIQCKHHSRPVGRPQLQKLLGEVTSVST